QAEPCRHRSGRYRTGAVEWGEYDAQGLGLAQNSSIDNNRFEPLHISFVDLGIERYEFSLSILGKWLVLLGPDRVHFRDDAARMRLDDLRAIGKVNLVAVIVRRIVARGNDDARGRVQVT